LSPRNESALQHYRECRAVGCFPDDPIVRANAAIVRAWEDLRKRQDDSDFYSMLLTMVSCR
jgi:hypothetical protein